jgi:hypothetical protein
MWCRMPRGDDSPSAVSHGVNYEQKPIGNEADTIEALFPVFVAFEPINRERVVERFFGYLEAHIVLSEVRRCFPSIPFELVGHTTVYP